jgi:N-acetylglucosamine-6-phosphate deacetylase
MTLAPELDGALKLIAYVRRNFDTAVAVGHHLASRDRLSQAAETGATLITHLGNGCPNLLPRHENVLVHQLSNDSFTAGLITDGHHLPPDFIKVAVRCKGADAIFVVSDSAPIASFEPGIYETLGHSVRLTSGGRIESLAKQHLVGSGCSMAQCMRYLHSLHLLEEPDLWKAGLLKPLEILRIPPNVVETPELPDFRF